MAVLLDKDLALCNTEQLRLSIQIDLSGFSFIVKDIVTGGLVYHAKFTFPMGIKEVRDTEEIFAKELKESPVMKHKFGNTRLYFDTEKYYLAPDKFFDKESILKKLNQLYKIEDLEEVYYKAIPVYDAVLAYSIPHVLSSPLFIEQNSAEFYPIIYPLIEQLPEIKQYNKFLAYFKKGVVHIVAAQGNRLLLCNSFPAKDFITASYFIFFVAKEVLFNPGVTTLHLYGAITYKDSQIMSKYFKETNRCDFIDII